MNKTVFIIMFVPLLHAMQCKKSAPGMDSAPMLIMTIAGDEAAQHGKSFLALGDSYTIGQSVAPVERFPQQTVSLLRNMGLAVDDPDYIAATGWTTKDLAKQLAENNPDHTFDIVTLLIGVNDQYQWHDTTGYRSRFLSLLNTSIKLAGGNQEHVIVLSIPDYSVTTFARDADTAAIRQEINWFNTINKEIASGQHCHYLNITALTREAKDDISLLANDGLHPSGKEYALWAKLLSQIIYTFLQ